MIATRLVRATMIGVMLVAPSIQPKVLADTAPKAAPAQRVYFNTSFDTGTPAQNCDELWELSQHRKLTYEEQMDLGMALFLLKNWDRAAGVYQGAAANMTQPTKKAAALCGAAQSLAAIRNWHDAAVLMNEANQLVPNAKAAAALRYAYWTNAGDTLEIQIAQDRMKQLNLRAEGQVTCVATGYIVVVEIVALAVKYVLENTAAGPWTETQVGTVLYHNIGDLLDTTITAASVAAAAS